MNLLIPDKWLREYLKTEATPRELKEYLSLCGPSVERVNKVDTETVYDIEVTTNRADTMSIAGISREAQAIVPRFGVAATLENDPYSLKTNRIVKSFVNINVKPLSIETNAQLNPRWTSVVIDNIHVKPSPKWLQELLLLAGIRPINVVVDITNYLMRAYGQPAHAFDYDSIKPKKGVPTMILRESKKGEHITTLDGKTHTLPGGDIIIEDGLGRLIDLCGIMGGENSSIKLNTKTIVLFMQTYKPERIRKTSMALGHRTEAASIFEKGVDTELTLPALIKGIELTRELAGGRVASKIYDLYPKPFMPYTVSVTHEKLTTYLGKQLEATEITEILSALGFKVTIDKRNITVSVPSFRRDVQIDVDVIEEIARIYGYHNLQSSLPANPPPITQTDPLLDWEKELKIRLRDWGYTETYTYSMISEELMDMFALDKTKAYKIANPLSSEWVYMRPHLLPSLLAAVRQNLNICSDFTLFELSNIYRYRPQNLPFEEPSLNVVWTGPKFLEAKGLAESIFHLFGIEFPHSNESTQSAALNVYAEKSLALGKFGSLGELEPQLLQAMGIKAPITRLYLNFEKLVQNAKSTKQYQPIPKYPPIIEDLSFTLPEHTLIGEVMQTVESLSTLVDHVEYIDQFQNTATFRIYYLKLNAPLKTEEVSELRKKIIAQVKDRHAGEIKGSVINST